MCHWCHTLKNNPNAPNHRSINCTDKQNPYSLKFEKKVKNTKRVKKTKRVKAPHHIKNVACFMIKDGCTLLVQEKNGKWGLPGGKLNKNEKPFTGMRREFKEEVCSPMPGKSKKLKWKEYYYHGHTMIFVAEVERFGSSNFKRNNEIKAIAYVKLEDIFTYTLRNCVYKSLKMLQEKGVF